MDKYSPLYWNNLPDAGGLTRDQIQAVTGMQFSTKWNPDNTVEYFWYQDVRNRAPGFAAAGLLLDPGPTVARDVTPFIGAADYPNWVVFKSAQGYVAPGANAAWTPALDENYTPVQGHISPAPSTPIGVGPLTVPPASATPPVPYSPTAPITTALPMSIAVGEPIPSASPQPQATAARTPPNVWLWLALAGAALLAFAYFRGHD